MARIAAAGPRLHGRGGRVGRGRVDAGVHWSLHALVPLRRIGRRAAAVGRQFSRLSDDGPVRRAAGAHLGPGHARIPGGDPATDPGAAGAGAVLFDRFAGADGAGAGLQRAGARPMALRPGLPGGRGGQRLGLVHPADIGDPPVRSRHLVRLGRQHRPGPAMGRDAAPAGARPVLDAVAVLHHRRGRAGAGGHALPWVLGDGQRVGGDPGRVAGPVAGRGRAAVAHRARCLGTGCLPASGRTGQHVALGCGMRHPWAGGHEGGLHRLPPRVARAEHGPRRASAEPDADIGFQPRARTVRSGCAEGGPKRRCGFDRRLAAIAGIGFSYAIAASHRRIPRESASRWRVCAGPSNDDVCDGRRAGYRNPVYRFFFCQPRRSITGASVSTLRPRALGAACLRLQRCRRWPTTHAAAIFLCPTWAAAAGSPCGTATTRLVAATTIRDGRYR